jgi:ribosomal protein S18 acetylase RimI-like enzyme
MPKGISVRLATSADRAGFTRVARETHAHHVALLPGIFRDVEDSFWADYFDGMLAGPETWIMLAERAGAIAGYATLRLRRATLPIQVQRTVAYIDNFGVAASARRHGVGRALFTACQERARALGAESLDLDCWEANQSAMRFYEALGMRPTRRWLTLDL